MGQQPSHLPSLRLPEASVVSAASVSAALSASESPIDFSSLSSLSRFLVMPNETCQISSHRSHSSHSSHSSPALTSLITLTAVTALTAYLVLPAHSFPSSCSGCQPVSCSGCQPGS